MPAAPPPVPTPLHPAAEPLYASILARVMASLGDPSAAGVVALAETLVKAGIDHVVDHFGADVQAKIDAYGPAVDKIVSDHTINYLVGVLNGLETVAPTKPTAAAPA